MHETLKELNQAVGVKGSMLVADDGMVILSALGTDLEEEVVGAMGTAIVRSTGKALAAMGSAGFSRFVLAAEYGKIVIMDTGGTFLLVVTDKEINLDITMLEIASAVHKIAAKSKISLL